MNAQIRAAEFRNFTVAQSEMLAAMRANNKRLANQAREELEAIGMHTAWESLRARCTTVLASTQH